VEPATFKVAAPWSTGVFTELKTYGHACDRHIGPIFQSAEERRRGYVACAGETLEQVGIYRYEQGKRDRQLERQPALEVTFRG
jgi:hypothetical protein